jgi:predicted dehydrogenase
MNINAGIIGTGYGRYVILESLKKIKYIKKIIINGRNKPLIEKLNKNRQVSEAYSSLNVFLKKKDISLLCIATVPIKQFQILNRIKKKQYNFFFLEKPIANNHKNIIKIYNKFKSIKEKVAVDFIFLSLNSFRTFKSLIKNKKILNVNIKWHFKAHHYKNNIEDTWKKNPKLGGGIYYFYIIHMISYINFFFGRITKVIEKNEVQINSQDIFGVFLDLECSKNLRINMDFNSNSNKNIHEIEVVTKRRIFKLEKRSKDHVNNFIITKFDNNKILLKKITFKKNHSNKDTRIEPVKNILNNLLKNRKPTSSIYDAYLASNDLEKIVKASTSKIIYLK